MGLKQILKKLKTFGKVKKVITILIAILLIFITFLVMPKIKQISIVKEKEKLEIEEQQLTVPDGYIGITTAEELQNMQNDLTAKYILMSDIDMTDIEWTVIASGTSSRLYFTGIFDGNNHKISNLNIEATNAYVGMLGYINGGTVKNLTLENINVVGENTATTTYIGGLAGYINGGTIENITIQGNNSVTSGLTEQTVYIGGLLGYTTGTSTYTNIEINNIRVIGDTSNTLYEGGLIGYVYGTNTKIDNAVIKGSSNIESTENVKQNFIGGLIGYQNASTIRNSHTEVEIIAKSKSNAYIGGLIGQLYNRSSSSTNVSNSYSNSNITNLTTGTSYLGGLIGYHSGYYYSSTSSTTTYYTTIEKVYSTGTITIGTGANYVGGLVGYGYYSKIYNAYSTVNIEGSNENTNTVLGGLIGNTNMVYVYYTYAVGKITENVATTKLGSIVGNNVGSTYAYYSYWSPEVNGEKVKASTIGIKKSLLQQMLYQDTYTNWDFSSIWGIKENGESLPYLLNLEIPEEILEENLEYYKADGRGTQEEPYVITKIEQLQEIPITDEEFYFILGNDIDASEIENFIPIEGSFIGILDGNDYSINNLTIKSDDNNVGLFKQNNGTIKKLKLNNINIESNYSGETAYIGGICGINNGTIKGVEINGTIENIGTITDLYIGQITGNNSGLISKTHSDGTLNNTGAVTNAYIGGITGINCYKIQMTYNTGNTIISNVTNLKEGGIAGQSRGIINNVYSKEKAKISANSAIIGGIVGINSGIVKNTYSTNSIEKDVEIETLGGIIGEKYEHTIITSSYYNISNIEETVGKGTLRALDEFKKQSTFEDWNFSEIWHIDEDIDTPVFCQETYNDVEKDLQDLQEEDYYGTDFWEWHTRTTTDDKAYNGKHIVINTGESINFYGYGITSYKDYLYKHYSGAGEKIFMFKIDETKANYHTLDGAGFIFNAKKENNLLSGYVLLIQSNTVCIYRIDNVNATTFETGSNATVATYGTLVASTEKTSSTMHNLMIKTSPTNVTVIDNGEEILNVVLDYTKHAGEDFGLIASYSQHNCSLLSKISFMEFEMQVQDYTIPIIKTDENGNRLEGAKFQIKNEEGKVVNEGTTNLNGIYNIEGIQEGIYTLEEIETPAKCIVQTYSYTFKITNDGRAIDVETGEEVLLKVINEKLKIGVKVVDTKGNGIKGAVIKLYDKYGNEVKGSNGIAITATTNEEGNAIFTDIDAGSYNFKQISTPEEYIIDETLYGVNVVQDGTVIYKDDANGIINKKYGYVTIKNYETGTTTRLSGTVIEIYDSEGNVLIDSSGNPIRLTTDEYGTITFKLPPGEYKYKQITSTNGYVLDDNIYVFTIRDDGTVIFDGDTGGIIYNEISYIDIVITKVWVDTTEQQTHRPANIKIQVKNGDTVVQEKTITNTDTSVTFTGLPKYESNGDIITYTVAEVEVNENDLKYYTSKVEGDMNLGYTVINTFKVPSDTVNLTVRKEWIDNSNSAGKRPASVIITAIHNDVLKGQVTLTSSNAIAENSNIWEGTITGLPKYDSNGNVISYVLGEREVNEHDLDFYTITGVNYETNTVINTSTVLNEKVEIPVTKVWVDNNNVSGKRPSSVIIVAKSGDVVIGQVELTVANAIENNNNIWRGKIANLQKYDNNGDEIIYKIDEKEVNVGDLKYYTKSIVGNRVINTLNIKKAQYRVEHYRRNLDVEVEGYDCEIEYFEGIVGETVTAIPKNYEGFVENTTHPNRIPSGIVVEDSTLVLRLYYDREAYNISYVLNGGRATGTLRKTYIYEREIYLSRKVEKTGYEFAGWYDNSNFDGDAILKIERGETRDKVFYAKWIQKVVNSNTYSIDEVKEQISQVSPSTTAKNFLTNLNVNGNAKIYDLQGKEVSNDKLVGTGYTVKVEKNGETYEYQIAVKGDLDGDGKVSITDLSMMNQAIVGKKTLSEIVKTAADLDTSEKVSATDLSIMNQYITKRITF